MKTNPANRRHTPGSLRGPRTPRTLLLRMAADEARAERIRELKDQRPDLTWRRIGDAVGVSERSAVAWQKTGGIDYEHAKKLAAVFEVDLDWLWRGPVSEETPDLIETVARADQLEDIVEKFSRRVDDVEARLKEIERLLTDSDTGILALLERQSRILEDIRTLVGDEDVFAAFRQALDPQERAPAKSRRSSRTRASQGSRAAG